MNCFTTKSTETKKNLIRVVIKEYYEPPRVGKIVDFHKQGAGASKLENGNTNNSGNSGTINYNFYANNYTDAVDLSGAMSTSESSNGPGQGTYSNATQRNDLFGLLHAGANAISSLAPLLADPTTEEYEQSDRVSVEQAGTSTLISQATVGTSGYKGALKLPKETTAAADEPTHIGPSGHRFVTKVAQDWTAAQQVYQWQALHLPIGYLKAQSSPVQVMALRHHLIRCGWKVQVQVNSTRFHGGALGVFLVPEFVACTSEQSISSKAKWFEFKQWYDAQMMRDTPVNTVNTNDGQYAVTVDKISNSNLAPESLFAFPHQIINPRTNSSVTIQVPYVGCTPGVDSSTYNPWAIVIVVLRRLQYAAGATTALTITCSICPTNLIFHGLREPMSITQGPIPVQNSPAQQAWSNTQPETAKPAYPEIFSAPSEYLPAEFKDYTQLSKIPCLVHTRKITALQSKPATAIYKCPIRPLCEEIRPTLLGTTTAMYAQWRGSMAFRVVFTGNQMQNVRMVLCYTPPDYTNAEPTTMEEAMMGTYVIYDTGIDSSGILTVPYISMADFTPVWCVDRDGKTTTNLPTWTHGWFTIWQYTDLAVPPGSPTTADFLVFVYAGQDYSLKGPASLIASVQGKAEPLRPGEDGVSTDANLDTSMERSNPIPVLPPKSSSVAFFWDRFFYLGNKQIDSTNKDYFFDLDPFNCFTNMNTLRATHATYIRADLDITLKVISESNNVQNGKSGELIATFVPPGACSPMSGNFYAPNIMVLAGGLPYQFCDLNLTNTLTFSVPFTSIAAAVPTVYAGGKSAALGGTPPNLNYPPSTYGMGALTVRLTRVPSGQTQRVLLFVRYRNFRAWCPRPGYPLITNKTTDDASSEQTTPDTVSARELPTKQGARNKDLLLLAGDVEENPGPAVLSAIKMLSDPMFQTFCDQYDVLKEKYGQLQQTINSIFDNNENEFVRKVVKFIGYGLLAYRAAKDPLTAAAIAFILGSDFVAWAIGKVTKWLKDTMTTPAPPFAAMRMKDLPKPCCCGGACNGTNPFCEEKPDHESLIKKIHGKFTKQGFLQDANAVVNLCKGAEWIATQIRKVYDWLLRWKQQEEENSPQHFQKLMAQYPQMFMKYRQCRNNYRHPDRKEVAQYFEKLRKLAAIQNPRLVSIFPVLDETPTDPTRPEPVVLLLKGKPGQGKSVAAELLAKMLSQTLTGKREYFSFNSSLSHFDGYQQQSVVVLDDLGQNPDGLDFKMFCQLVSTTTCILPMADLADKGREFKSEILICTTNLPALNPVTITDPKALERRIFLECEVEAAQAYQKFDGSLDLARALKPTGNESPNVLLDTDRFLFHSDALKFTVHRGKRPNVYSLIDIFNLLKRELSTRQEISCNLDSIFSKQAPRDADEQLAKLIAKWKNEYTDPGSEDMLALKVIELCHGCNVLKEYTHWYSEWKKRKQGQFEAAIRKINLVLSSIVIVLSLLATLFAIYQICSAVTEEKTPVQSAYAGNVPKPKPRTKQSLLEMVQMQSPSKEIGMEVTVAKKNLILAPVKKTNGKLDTFHVLAVGGTRFITNYHQWETIEEIQIQGEWYRTATLRAALGMVNDMESDVVMFDIPGVQPHRNITQFFYDGHYPRGHTVRGIDLHSGEMVLWSGTTLAKKKCLDTWEGPIPAVLTYNAQTYSGYCGTPVFLDTGISKKICGIHCAGTGIVGSASEITIEMIRKLMEALDKACKQGKIWDVYKVPFVYTPTKTALKPTHTCVNPKLMPAALSPFDKRLVNPEKFKSNILAKHVGDSNKIPAAVLMAAREYAGLVKTYSTNVAEPLTVPQAIEGFDGLDGMDYEKSPGYPYILHGLRRKHLVGDNLELIGLAKAEYSRYEKNDYAEHVFTTFLKDELRPKEKVWAGKTRVIDISSFPHAVRGRVIFGNLFALFHKNPSWTLGSAVGCNPDVDWTRFYYTAPGKHILAMDYSGFDSTHSTAMFAVLKIFLSELGFGEDAMAYIDSLSNSRHIWDDEHYRMAGGLPSGCAGTTIFNTILNNIVTRAALKYVGCDETAGILCYGDDILVSSDEQFPITEWTQFYEQTPYRITSADKNLEIQWSTLKDVTFLKRKFVEDHGLVRPVMDEENIHQLLMWARPNTLQEKIQSLSRIAVHCGRAAYERLFGPFVEVGYYVPPFDNLDLDFKYNLIG